MKPLISVVIPTYKRPDSVKTLLESLMNQTLPIEKFEVIIVDNNSEDETEQTVKKFISKYKNNLFYFLQKKKGAAAARNLGFANAKSEIILFLDDDMIASPALLEEHLRFHNKNPEENKCVLGYFETEWNEKDDTFLKFLHDSALQNDFPDDSGDDVSYNYFFTGNISCSSSAIKKVGGFDEGFSVYGVEDIDLGYRLTVDGNKIYFNKKAFSIHNYNPGIEEFLKKREKVGMSLGYFLNKFPHLKGDFNFGKFPWFFLGFGHLVYCKLAGFFINKSKSYKYSKLHYIYYRLLLRWSMFKNYFLYNWRRRSEKKGSLSKFLN